MFGILRRKLGAVVHNGVINSTTQLGSVQNHCRLLFSVLRIFSSSSLEVTDREDEIRQGFHGESLLSASKKLPFEEQAVVRLLRECGSEDAYISKFVGKYPCVLSAKSGEVLSLLRHYGLTDAHVSNVIRNFPEIVMIKPKITRPKIEFLLSIEASRSDLCRIISRNPRILSRSFERTIIPCYNALKNVVLCNKRVVKAFTVLSWTSIHYLHKNLPVNVSVLEGLSLPQSIISSLMLQYPRVMCVEPAKFSKAVDRAIELGFDPSQKKFCVALVAVSGQTQRQWDHRMDVFRRWGLSEGEVLLAFKKDPKCMFYSEKKIMSTMDFLVNQMGWEPVEVIRNPVAYSFNLEKRIVPRCSIVRVLLLKGLIKKSPTISSILVQSDRNFIGAYVVKYQKQIHQLLQILQGEMSILELGFAFEEKLWTKDVQH